MTDKQLSDEIEKWIKIAHYCIIIMVLCVLGNIVILLLRLGVI